MRRDRNQAGVLAVVAKPLDELVVSLCLVLRHGGVDYLGVELGVELPNAVQAITTPPPHANDVVRVLVSDLTDCVKRVPFVVAFDPHLLSLGDSHSSECPRIGRTVFVVVLQIML